MYSDENLEKFMKFTKGDFSHLSDKDLLELKYELTQVPSRKRLPVPMTLISEIRERGIEKKEEKGLYGEYGSGK